MRGPCGVMRAASAPPSTPTGFAERRTAASGCCVCVRSSLPAEDGSYVCMRALAFPGNLIRPHVFFFPFSPFFLVCLVCLFVFATYVCPTQVGDQCVRHMDGMTRRSPRAHTKVLQVWSCCDRRAIHRRRHTLLRVPFEFLPFYNATIRENE